MAENNLKTFFNSLSCPNKYPVKTKDSENYILQPPEKNGTGRNTVIIVRCDWKLGAHCWMFDPVVIDVQELIKNVLNA